MLRYTLRLVPLVLRARFSGPSTVSRLGRRVRLTHVDFNRHMNQAAYAVVAEEGRTDLVLRSGLWPHLRERGILAVVASQQITYRRELKPLQRFVVDSRAVAVEGRLLRIDSHLLVGRTVHARVEARLIFIGSDGVLPPEAVPPVVEGFLHAPLSVDDWTVSD